MWMEIGAVGAIGVLAYQSLALHYERRALKRAKQWYNDQNNDYVRDREAILNAPPEEGPGRYYMAGYDIGGKRTHQMCGGCGRYLTEEEIAKCPGEKCSHFVETALQSSTSQSTNQIPPVGG